MESVDHCIDFLVILVHTPAHTRSGPRAHTRVHTGKLIGSSGTQMSKPHQIARPSVMVSS